MIERTVEFIHSLRPKGVAHFGAIEGDAHGALIDGSVVRDVLE
jgi:hypothetical protein